MSVLCVVLEKVDSLTALLSTHSALASFVIALL